METKKIKRQKIFFIYPPNSNKLNQHENNLPVDMMMLSTVAKKRGYITKFCDYSKDNLSLYDFLRDLRMFKPDFLLINVTRENFEEDLSILSQNEDLFEDIVIIAKGEIFNYNSYTIMQKYPQIDIALRGDIEGAFDEIIQYNDLKEIEGITYQINNKISSTKDRIKETSLDNLPVLDRELVNNNLYINPLTKQIQSSIVVSSGDNQFDFYRGNKFEKEKLIRLKNTSLIIDEIKDCVRKYEIKNFFFEADFFNFDNNWVDTLSKQILENNLRINFSTRTKADSLDFETIEIMKKAGCNFIILNVLSASEAILERMNEKNNLEEIKETVALLSDAKIQIQTEFNIGFPWETKETINETYNFAKELNTHSAIFKPTIAYSQTKYFDYLIKNRLAEPNPENPYALLNPRSFALSREEILAHCAKLNKSYYLRPNYFLKKAFEIDSLIKLKSRGNNFSKSLKMLG